MEALPVRRITDCIYGSPTLDSHPEAEGLDRPTDTLDREDSTFQCTNQIRPRKANAIADMLSRPSVDLNMVALTATTQSDLLERVRQAYRRSKFISQLKRYMYTKVPIASVLNKVKPEYVQERDGLLYYGYPNKHGQNQNRLILPEGDQIVQTFIDMHHNSVLCGHPGEISCIKTYRDNISGQVCTRISANMSRIVRFAKPQNRRTKTNWFTTTITDSRWTVGSGDNGLRGGTAKNKAQ